jgi:hypothetical protein
MWYFSRNEGDSTFYWRITGIVGLTVIAVMALARVLAWYVFRFGRSRLASVSPRVAWEIAWKPVLTLNVMCYAIVCIPMGVMFWQQDRRVAALPVVTVADSGNHAGQTFRVEGRLASDPVYWAPNGTGRGGNNYAGAGVLVNLSSGGEALLLAESMVVSDFIFAINDAHDGEIKSLGKVIDEITDDQRKYYGLDEAAFPPADGGRVMVLLTTP